VIAAWALSEPPPYGRPKDRLGRRGEEAAARHLESQGLRIVAAGFRTAAGEIDLIAQDGDELVFVEVKTRSSLRCGRPGEAVDARKQARLARVARIFLTRSGGEDRPCRFDVVEILEVPGGAPRIHHIRDAFQAN
jgi:putative endonuclease